MSVSFKTPGTSYDELLTFTPDAGIITAKNLYIFQLPFGVLLLILVAFCGTLLWQFCNSSYFVSHYPHFTKMKRFKLVVWLLQLISSVTCLIVLFSVLKPCVLWNGTLFPGVVSGELDLDWNYQVSWLETLDDLWIFLGWGVFPSLFVYIFEITPIGPYAPRSAIHLHHFTVVLTVLYGIKAFVSTYDATWIQMGITLYFHIILEIPIWLALLAYRLESKNAAFYLGLATAYEAGLRLVLWISGFLIYAKLCWLRFTYTPWEVIWRVAFPIICIMLMVAQIITIKIHYFLYCHVAKKQAVEGRNAKNEKEIEMTDNRFVTNTSSTAADSIEMEMGKSNDEGDDDTATLPATRRNSDELEYADIYPNNTKNTELVKEERKLALERSSFFYQNHLTIASNNGAGGGGGGGKSYEKLALDSPTSSYRSSPNSLKERKKLRVSWSDSKDENDSPFSPSAVSEMRSLSPEKPGSFIKTGKKFPAIMVKKIDEEEKDAGTGSSGNDGEGQLSPSAAARKARSESEDSIGSPVSSVYHRSTDELLGSYDDSANPVTLTIDLEAINKASNSTKKEETIANRVPLNLLSFDSYYDNAQSMSIDLEAGGGRGKPLQRQSSQDSNFSSSLRSIRSLGSMRFDSFFIQDDQPSSGNKGKKGEPTKQRTAFFGIKTNTLTYWFLYGFYLPFFVILFGTSFFTSNVGYYSEVSSGQRIAVIGGGITGLGATWSLSKHPKSFSKITLFESQESLGGNAQSYYYSNPITGKQESFIDQGFSQFNSHYTNLLMLLKHLNQTTLLNYVYFTGVLPDIDEIKDSNDILSSQSGELLSLSRSFYRNSTLSTTYMAEINRLSSLLDEMIQGWTEKELMTTTLGHFLKENEFSDGFTFRYMPICLNLYVASSVGMFDIPIILFYYMENVFKACLTSSPVSGRHLGNGTTAYIDALVKDIQNNNNQVEIRTKTSIQAIQINNPKSLTSKGTVKILSSDGKWTEYDQIIFATYRKNIYNIFHHPESKVCPTSDYLLDSDTCESLYDSLFDNHEESGSALYSIVHNDTNYMKNVFGRLQDEQGCWNYQHYNFYSLMNYTNPSDLTSNTASSNSIHLQLPYTQEEPMLSYCQEEPKPPFLLHTHVPYTSLNPSLQVDSTKILNSKSWYHNNHNNAFFGKTRNNYLVQGLHNMWYAGVDFTLNFHEHALVSGLIIAHKLGAGYPFQHDSLAKGTFINYRNWMLYGLNPLIPPTTERGRLKPQNQQQ
jgi:predicted NAD/FAD-binding protein